MSTSSSGSSSRRSRPSPELPEEEGDGGEAAVVSPADKQEHQEPKQQHQKKKPSKKKPVSSGHSTASPNTAKESFGSNDEFGGEEGDDEDETEVEVVIVEDEDDDIDSTAMVEEASPGASGNDKNNGFKPVDWNPPVSSSSHHAGMQHRTGGREDISKNVSKEALNALQSAAEAAKQFDTFFGSIKNAVRENMTALYHSEEVLTAREPLRQSGYYTEYVLTAVRLGEFGDLPPPSPNQVPSTPSEKQNWARHRFMERSIDGHYAVKYLQAGLIEATDHGGTAAADMIYETRILMNLTPQHPNIAPIHGVNAGGIDTFLETSSPKDGFFFISDRIVETLTERLEHWRWSGKKGRRGSNAGQNNALSASLHGSPGAKKVRLGDRLDVAFDISSALLFLHDRSLVYHVRPDKVGFDAKHGRVKLCNFSQARYNGMKDHQSRSITKSDDITSLRYTAPEVLCKSPGTTSCDVYGFGIILWELMSLRYPFEGYDRARHFEQVVQQHKRPPMNKKWNEEIRDLLRGCWDPHLRLSMKKAHQILEQVIFNVAEEEQNHQQLQSGLQSTQKPAETSDGAAPAKISRRFSMGENPGAQTTAQTQLKQSHPQSPKVHHNENNNGTRIPRRNSTGGAQGIEQLKQKRPPNTQQGAADANKTASPRSPRVKAHRRRSQNGNEKPPTTIFLTDDQEEVLLSPSQKGSSRSQTRTSDHNSHSSSPNARSPYHSPRRSSLGHIPAGSTNSRQKSDGRHMQKQDEHFASPGRASKHKIASAKGAGHEDEKHPDAMPKVSPKSSDSMLDYVKAKRRASVS